jgi:putative ABC transport system substrate-binding protein
MKRREFITLIGGGATWPIVARAQQDSRVRRVGVLMAELQNDPESRVRTAAFQQEVEKLGWIVGRNLTIDYRWPAGDLARTYYAGDPVRTAATLYRRRDAAPLLAYIARALGQETATPTPR